MPFDKFWILMVILEYYTEVEFILKIPLGTGVDDTVISTHYATTFWQSEMRLKHC